MNEVAGSEWTGRVGQSWAQEWQRTDRSFAAVTDHLFASPVMRDFSRAVDIGCGAGETSCRLAAGQPDGAVLGLDISADLLDVARQRGAELPNLRFALGDAARWAPEKGEAPDLLVSRHGVMFFDDPIAAFTHIRDVAAKGATLRFSCFRERRENGWVRELMSVLPAPAAAPDPYAPGPFAFGERQRVEDVLQSAGWQDLTFEAFDYPMVAGAGPNAIDEATAYFLRIGAAARAIAELPDVERQGVVDRLRAMLAAHHQDAIVALPAAVWIVTATNRG